MKAGIITFHNVINYGATLQALALQKTIEKFDVSTEIIDYSNKKVTSIYKPFSFYKLKKAFRKSVKYGLKTILSDGYHFLHINKKNKAFSAFCKKYYNLSNRKYKTLYDVQNYCTNYDICFAGSDQIWNPDITQGFDSAYFLDFGSKEMKRVSYAASIGRDTFSKEEANAFKKLISNFDKISVREKTATNIVSQMVNKNVETVLDPTLLLSAEEWSQLLNIKKTNEKYIFVYELYNNPQLNLMVEELSKKTGLPVITLTKKRKFLNELKRFSCADPAKFVELIANAEYVVTNSFHGTAFSINFSKQFFTFLGESRNSRILDLFESLGIEKHRANKEYNEELLSLSCIDYKGIQERLNEIKTLSKEYVKSALKMGDNK